MLFCNIKGGNILGNSYKICFLGYRKLREMAQQVIDKLNYQDTTVVMKECAIETLEQVVNEADSEGCQVFVAGSANAEEFKQRFSEHLVELHIDMSDYGVLPLPRPGYGGQAGGCDHLPQEPPDEF